MVRKPAVLLWLALGAMVMLPGALAQPPETTWISIDGSVTEVERDAFTLDYGAGELRVAMADEDRDANAYELQPDFMVTVTGPVNGALFEEAVLEAQSVYVAALGAYFHAGATDPPFVSISEPVVKSSTILRGRVSAVGDEGFTLGTGESRIEVDVTGMSGSPMDPESYQALSTGDYVSVTGKLGEEFLAGRQFGAETVTTMVASDNQDKS